MTATPPRHNATPAAGSGEMPLPEMLDGVEALLDRYDAFIVDLWGVIHDGENPLPGIEEGLATLKRAGKVVCLLSNAPRRSEVVAARMREMGIGDDLYTHILTSGEATYAALADRNDDFHRSLGNRLLHIGPPRDNDTYSIPGLEVVGRADDATFVLTTGIDEPEETVDDYASILEEAAARDLPMVCANPDLVVIAGGLRTLCAGGLAAHYETLGGRVAYHGKPHPPVYARCRALIDETLSQRPHSGGAMPRILAIGDAFRTDILGAHQAGLDSLLITGHGIHCEELGVDEQGRADPVMLGETIQTYGLRPTLVMPGLRHAP
jgi:HAD superfamily hydrolase (TIGR01459 family)